jgi:hypothetical protein
MTEINATAPYNQLRGLVTISIQTHQVSQQELRDPPNTHSRHDIIGNERDDPDYWQDSQGEFVTHEYSE